MMTIGNWNFSIGSSGRRSESAQCRPASARRWGAGMRGTIGSDPYTRLALFRMEAAMDFSHASVWWIAAGVAVAAELATGTFYLLMIAMGLAAGALAAQLGSAEPLQFLA